MTRFSRQLQKGYTYLNNNQYERALEEAEHILTKRYNIDALVLAGMAYFRLNQYEQSEEYLKKAFTERPENEAIAVYLLESHIKNNNYEEGLNCTKKIKNKTETIQLLEIKLLQLLGRYNEAIRATKSLTKSIKKYEILAWNYELLNKLNKAQKNALKGIKIDADNFKCNIVLAKLCLRKTKTKKAKQYMAIINTHDLSHTNISIYYSIKAQILEKSGKYQKAFKNYKKSNDALMRTEVYRNLKGNNYYTLEKINIIKNYFSKPRVFQPLIACETSITFMLGFPRSGTTLLENILNAHTEINSIEEQPTLDDILHTFLETPQSIKKLETISEDEIEKLQQAYLKKRKVYCATDEKIIIDKMPLNIIHIGILYRIFPHAKFIVSTRDIRDVVLSCFFQNFAINDAMANFLDWDTTQEYLKELMPLGLDILNKYPIEHTFIAYEKLVESPFAHVKRIIEFLGLDWQESIKNYRGKIKGRNINTPSYAKIYEKINTKQIKKWEYYKFIFD